MDPSNRFTTEYVVRQAENASREEPAPQILNDVFKYLYVPLVILITIAFLRYIIRRHSRTRTRPQRTPRPIRPRRAFEPPPPVYAINVAGRPRNTIIVPQINQSATASLHPDTQYAANYPSPFPPALFSNVTEPHKEIHLRSFQPDDENKKLPCPICLDPLETEPVSAGNCNHMMHTSCLRGWLAKDVNSACPICRAPYDNSTSTPSLSSSSAAL